MQRAFYVVLAIFTVFCVFQHPVFSQTGNLDQDEQLRRDAERLSRISEEQREEAKERYDTEHPTQGGSASGFICLGFMLLTVGIVCFSLEKANGGHFVSKLVLGFAVLLCLAAIWQLVVGLLLVGLAVFLILWVRHEVRRIRHYPRTMKAFGAHTEYEIDIGRPDNEQ